MEELKIPKYPFEINLPLDTSATVVIRKKTCLSKIDRSVFLTSYRSYLITVVSRDIIRDVDSLFRFWVHQFLISAKGQIISEQNCGVLNFPRKRRNYCKDICPSHYNGSNKENKGTLSCKFVIYRLIYYHAFVFLI